MGLIWLLFLYIVHIIRSAGGSNPTDITFLSPTPESLYVEQSPPFSNADLHLSAKHRVSFTSPLGLIYAASAVGLVLFAGLASGMTVGLMSLDPVQLKVFHLVGTAEQKKGVEVVSKLIKKHHLLLVTLLLANSLAMEALPLFLDQLIPSWAAVILSVTAIFFFGEIIPQALCTGPHQLRIAQKLAPLVYLLIYSLMFIAWPIAKVLDYLLGDTEQTLYYARGHLKALIRLHERERRSKSWSEENRSSSPASSPLGADEVNVIEGALDLASKRLYQIMMPLDEIFMLEADTILNQEAFKLILQSGHSRIPVYSKNRRNIKGLLLTKSLLSVDPNSNVHVRDVLAAKPPIFAHPDTDLYNLLNEFRKARSHMAFVTEFPDQYIECLEENADVSEEYPLMGIATLEDIIEELIQEEIYDEFDQKGHTEIVRVLYESKVYEDRRRSERSHRGLDKSCLENFDLDILQRSNRVPEAIQELHGSLEQKSLDTQIHINPSSDLTTALLVKKRNASYLTNQSSLTPTTAYIQKQFNQNKRSNFSDVIKSNIDTKPLRRFSKRSLLNTPKSTKNSYIEINDESITVQEYDVTRDKGLSSSQFTQSTEHRKN